MAISPPKAPPRATTVVTAPPPRPKPVPDPLPDGFAATRERVRRRGWMAGVLLPVVMIGIAALVLEIPANGHIANLLGITGSLLALCAVPTAVAFGIPVEVGPVRAVLAVVTSLLLWGLLGWWAGRRVSQRVIGGWREWAVEFGWVAVCLWAGVLTGVGILLHLAS
ncbi:MAG TPA: hypothetical protein VMK16_17130 [Acidimicrobiales bacterium]|nr:hypothetical protein [Acidimicrobiales bacterium]